MGQARPLLPGTSCSLQEGGQGEGDVRSQVLASSDPQDRAESGGLRGPGEPVHTPQAQPHRPPLQTP